MSSLKEIKNRIKSVDSIRQITKAMKLISSSRIRKVEQLVRARAPYADTLALIMSGALSASEEFSHPLLTEVPSPERIGILVVSGDKGLCGAFNSSVIKHSEKLMKDSLNEGRKVVNYVVGSKAVRYYSRRNYNAALEIVGWEPDDNLVDSLYTRLISDFNAGVFELLYIVSGSASSRSSYCIVKEKIIPFAKPEDSSVLRDCIFEPSPALILELLLPLLIRQVLLTKLASARYAEYVARIIAMTNANDNADTLTEELRLNYFRARQSAITTELLEVAAAAAFD